MTVEGTLEFVTEGWGFLRHAAGQASDRDVYVSQTQIEQFRLKHGDVIRGIVLQPRADVGETYYGLLKIERVNGQERAIEVNMTIHKQTPDASGPWVPGIEIVVPEWDSPLRLTLDEAEELGESLLHEVDGLRHWEREQEQGGAGSSSL